MNLKIVQVVGYKNSGKTTAITHLINAFNTVGYSVATLKHHAHAELNPLDNKKTDTGKHRASGAAVTTLVSPSFTSIDYLKEPPLKALIAFYQEIKIDILLIEGFKNAPYPKLLFIRNEEDWHALQSLENVQAVVIPEMINPANLDCPIPVFSRDQPLIYTSFIRKWMEDQK